MGVHLLAFPEWTSVRVCSLQSIHFMYIYYAGTHVHMNEYLLHLGKWIQDSGELICFYKSFLGL